MDDAKDHHSPFRETGFRRVLKAFGHSINGLRFALLHESAFRQELAIAVLLLPVIIWLPFESLERLFLLTTLFVVLVVELLNTAIEAVVDRVSLELHPLSKLAKDLGSAAVWLTLAWAALVWVWLLISLYLRTHLS